MGWSGGSEIADTLIDIISTEVKNKTTRKRMYIGIIEELENHDWDTQEESLGQDDVFDEALKELHPEWEEDEDNQP